MQRDHDIVPDVRCIGPRFDRDQIRDADHAIKSTDFVSRGFLLEVPINFPSQGDPGFLDLHLDGVFRNGHVPRQAADRCGRYFLLATLDAGSRTSISSATAFTSLIRCAALSAADFSA